MEEKQITPREKYTFFLQKPLQLATELRKKLYADSFFYKTAIFANVGAEDAKKLFLYSVAREIQKASIALMERLDDVSTPDVAVPKDDSISSEIIEYFSDQQQMCIRKLSETLCLLILLENSGSDLLYRIYRSSENLHNVLSEMKTFSAYYGSDSKNMLHSAKTFHERVRADIAALPTGVDAWFLKDQKNLISADTEKLRAPIFGSFNELLKAALVHASAEEKIQLGLDYRSYSSTSTSVHFQSLPRRDEPELHRIEGNFVHISLISLHILSRVQSILGIDLGWDIRTIMLEKSDASALLDKQNRSFEVGDVVIVHDLIAEVVGINSPDTQYRSYKIEYLDKSPLGTDDKIDDVPSSRIVLITNKSGVRAIFKKSFEATQKEKIDLGVSLDDLTDDWLLETFKSLCVDLQKSDVLLPFLGFKK